MTITLILVLSLLPAGGMTVYAFRNGVKAYQLACIVAASVTAVILCSIIRNGVESFLLVLPYTRFPPARWITQAFILSAGIEEAGKAVLFAGAAHIVQILRNKSGDFQNMGGYSGKPVYCAAVFFGLVFGGIETISYSIRYSDIVYQRLFSTIFLHGALGTFYPVLCTAPRRAAVYCASVCTAAALHGFYNMFAAMGGFFSLCAAAVFILTCNESRKRWAAASASTIRH